MELNANMTKFSMDTLKHEYSRSVSRRMTSINSNYNDDIDTQAADINKISMSPNSIMDLQHSYNAQEYRPSQNAKTARAMQTSGRPKNNKSIVVVCDPSTKSPARTTSAQSDRSIPSELWRSAGNLINYSSDDFSSVETSPAPIKSKKSSSSSDDDDSLLRNNPFANKLRHTAELRRNRRSSSTADALQADFHRFLPESTAANSSNLTPDDSGALREELQMPPSNETQKKYRQFTQLFHWWENIEHGSPWVQHRSKEIVDHVALSGLFDTLDNYGSEISSRGPGSADAVAVVHEDDGSHDTTSEYSITYGAAKKFCDMLTNENPVKNNDDRAVSENVRCTSNERGKWAKLYEKLVNYHY